MRVAHVTGVQARARPIYEVLQQAAEDFDAFYVERTPPTSTGTGSILVAAVDGKGIPMIKPEGGQRAVRLTKGQKANRKKMATVAAVFIRAAWIRTPQQVVESLFRREPTTRAGESPPPRPAQAGVGQPHQRQGCRDWRGGRRGATARSARPQDPRGPHRWRARPADSRQQESSGHPHSRSAPRVGKTLESRLRVPCRR